MDMRKKLVKLLKVLSAILLLFFLILAIAVIWPMPKLATPEKYDSILIKSVNVIDVESGNIIENRDILIKDNLISVIDTSGMLKPDPETLILDSEGKYVMPGLWDMHTHSNQHSEWLHHPLYIANGVTGVRDMSGQLNERDSYWAGSVERLKWNEELSNNVRVTPRYVLQSSYQMDGASSVPDGFPEFFKLQKPEDADALLDFYQNEQVDFIKVYQQILPPSYKRLALQAPKYGMHIAGHKPAFVSLEDAILLGQRSFEHGRIFLFESFPEADCLRTTKNWKQFFSTSKESMVEDFDPEIAKELMQLMKAHNSHWTPTLQTLKFEAYAHEESFLDNPNLKYITWVRKNLWWAIDAQNNKKRNLSNKGQGLSERFFRASREQVKMANHMGVPIMTGTDVTDSYTFAGFRMHCELEDLTKSGLSNLEALQCATIVPAKFAEKEDHYGSVESGKIADLAILNKNPLEDISHTKTISGVLMNGTYYDADKIDELKKYSQSNASSFHINVKALFSLINSPLIRRQFAD